MGKHSVQSAGGQLPRPERVLRRVVATIIALTAVMLAAPGTLPTAAQDGAGTGAIEVHVAECPAGYEGASYYDACHDNGIIGANVSINGPTADAKDTVEAGGPGVVRFADIPAGTYAISVNLPDTGQRYATYCSLEESDAEVVLSPSGSSAGTLELAEAQAVICDFYVFPPGEAQPPAADATDDVADDESEPAEADDESEPAEVDLASLVVDPVVCPPGTDVGVGFDALEAACTEPAENVTFTWGNADGIIETANTDAGPVAFEDIAPGTYTLYSDVPLEFAEEVHFCVADNGPRYEKSFSDNGVTTFNDVNGEDLSCDWFIVPFDLQGDPDDGRGEETGGSLIVHLAVCPQGYEGTSFYDDCHHNGVADQEFFLAGPGVDTSAVTTVPQEPGPGIAEFTGLPAGDYELAGGPPGDFGTVRLFCTLQPDGTAVETEVITTRATFALGEGEDLLCDWYYIPEDARGETPTPTVTPDPPSRAEIVVTLLACDPGETMAGASYADFVNDCDTPRDGVTFKLGDPGAPPHLAETGASGPGAVRFYDLLLADYTLTPSLPSGLSSAAVFCQIGGGDVYQKTITDGSTTFVNVNGESISCSWFATQPAPPAPKPNGPSGAITVREFLCEKDASAIEDWEQECKAGSSGSTFTVASTDAVISLTSATGADGVATFTELPDGFYTLKQNEGIWCKAKAERVDSQSRVIVENGQNTTVFIYQCAQVTNLPSTGTGTASAILPMDEPGWWEVATPVQQAMMGVGLLGAVILVGWARARRHATQGPKGTCGESPDASVLPV